MNQLILAVLLFSLTPFGVADEPAIDALLKVSPIVVVAEPFSENGNQFFSFGELSEGVLVKYSLRFRIKKILKSDTVIKQDEIISTHLAFFCGDTFEPREGKQVILFLRKASYDANSFENTSIWFGVMNHSREREVSLAFAIKEALAPDR